MGKIEKREQIDTAAKEADDVKNQYFELIDYLSEVYNITEIDRGKLHYMAGSLAGKNYYLGLTRARYEENVGQEK